MSNRLKEKAEAEVKVLADEKAARQAAQAGNAKEDIGKIPIFVSLKKIDADEPTWIVSLEGSSKEMTIKDVRDLGDYRRFVFQCIKQLDRGFPPMKPNVWMDILEDALAKIAPSKADTGTTHREVFIERLGEFLTNRTRGQRREDLLRGAPWEDEDKGRHYFRLQDLIKFLVRQGDRDVRRGQVTKWIKELGGDEGIVCIKGKPNVLTYWVPSTEIEAAPELDLPEHPPEDI